MKTRSCVSRALMGGVAGSIISTQCVTAQESGRVLEEVVVAARKRDEGLQTVPIAVSALTAAEMEGSYANKLDEMKGVPNVALDEAPGYRNVAAFYIRGIGYLSSSNPIPPFSSFNQPTDPRLYGVEVSSKF